MGKHIHISESEWKVMHCLWDNAPLTITQLVRALQPETGWSKGTVITTLNRLEAKEAIRYEDGGRARLYYPVVQERDIASRETEGFLKRVWRGDVGLMLSAMVDSCSISQADIEELRRILDAAGGDMHDA